MEINKAKLLVEDMLDICAQLEEDILNNACAGIYNDLQSSKSIEHVINCATELMLFVNDANWERMDGGEELRNDIEKIFNELIEEFEEF